MAARFPTDANSDEFDKKVDKVVDVMANQLKFAIKRWNQCSIELDLMKKKNTALEELLAKKDVETLQERTKHALVHELLRKIIDIVNNAGTFNTETCSALQAHLKDLEPSESNLQVLLNMQYPTLGDDDDSDENRGIDEGVNGEDEDDVVMLN